MPSDSSAPPASPRPSGELPSFKSLFPDTSPEALDAYYARLAAMTGEERVRLLFESSEFMFRQAEAGIRDRHPDYTDAEVRIALVRLTHGEEVFRQHFPGSNIVP